MGKLEESHLLALHVFVQFLDGGGDTHPGSPRVAEDDEKTEPKFGPLWESQRG